MATFISLVVAAVTLLVATPPSFGAVVSGSQPKAFISQVLTDPNPTPSSSIPAVNQSVLIRSPGYPASYKSGDTMGWYIGSPVGTKMIFKCEIFDVPCPDSFRYSLDGNYDSLAVQHCGQAGIPEVSTIGNRLMVSMNGREYATGGPRSPRAYYPQPLPEPQGSSKFQCKATAVPDDRPYCDFSTVASIPMTEQKLDYLCACGIRHIQTGACLYEKFPQG